MFTAFLPVGNAISHYNVGLISSLQKKIKKIAFFECQSSSTTVLIEDTEMSKQVNCKLNGNVLKIPTGERLTSWLFTKRGGVESDREETREEVYVCFPNVSQLASCGGTHLYGLQRK